MPVGDVVGDAVGAGALVAGVAVVVFILDFVVVFVRVVFALAVLTFTFACVLPAGVARTFTVAVDTVRVFGWCTVFGPFCAAYAGVVVMITAIANTRMPRCMEPSPGLSRRGGPARHIPPTVSHPGPRNPLPARNFTRIAAGSTAAIGDGNAGFDYEAGRGL